MNNHNIYSGGETRKQNQHFYLENITNLDHSSRDKQGYPYNIFSYFSMKTYVVGTL